LNALPIIAICEVAGEDALGGRLRKAGLLLIEHNFFESAFERDADRHRRVNRARIFSGSACDEYAATETQNSLPEKLEMHQRRRDEACGANTAGNLSWSFNYEDSNHRHSICHIGINNGMSRAASPRA